MNPPEYPSDRPPQHSPDYPAEYVGVVLDDAPPQTGGIWTYAVPEGMRDQVRVGVRVRVPFGARSVEGTVVSAAARPPRGEVRDIGSLVLDRPELPADLVDLALQVACTYACSPAQALRTVCPPGMRVREEDRVRVHASPEFLLEIGDKSRSPGVRRLAHLLAKMGRRRAWNLDELWQAWRDEDRPQARQQLLATLRAWQKKGWLNIERRFKPVAGARRGPEAGHGAALRGEAQSVPAEPVAAEVVAAKVVAAEVVAAEVVAAKVVAAEVVSPAAAGVLVWGGDGYARAEFYLPRVQECLERGQGVIVLLPEVEQVEQLAGWWSHLAEEPRVWHQRLSPAQLQRTWQDVYAGEVRLLLGTRSAVFAPMVQPGLLVIDNEHDDSYKQLEAPLYHGREVAAMRVARRRSAPGLAGSDSAFILGSATPQVETFYAAERGEYALQVLPAGPRPRVTVVDLRTVPGKKRGLLTPVLRAHLRECVAARKRAILFLNRRGYAGALTCRDCGETISCPRCRVSLVYHAPDVLRCHFCGFSHPVPVLCPTCRGRGLAMTGVGTQKLQEEVRRFLPGTPVLRLDTDAASDAREARAVRQAFLSQTPAVLVGTQMLRAARELPELGLVGMVNADVGLHWPDFRAAERTFALLYALGELAADWGGHVVLQTYRPQHHAVVAAAAHDYRRFYEAEIEARRELGYPPFSRLVRVVCAAGDEARARRGAEIVCRQLDGLVGRQVIEVLGPAPAPVSPRRGVYRWGVMVKQKSGRCSGAGVDGFVQQLETIGKVVSRELESGVRVTVDVDPYDMS